MTNSVLLTDLYQLTMAAGYLNVGRAEIPASFSLHFRRCPFGGAYAIAAGIEDALDYLEGLKFQPDDLQYLSGLNDARGKPVFNASFIEYLGRLEFRLNVEAMAEGTVVFPFEPLVQVSGPLLQAQLVETALLNMINFQTLVATKASRVCTAACGPNGPEPVLEFGLRRAQGVDGALSATRAAYIGGCAATSNVLAGQRFGIPVRGTHAHSWVMTFGEDRAAFEAYAATFPDGCVFLVDTFDTLEGVRTAISVATDLRERGHEMVGVRLDSGDLAELSIAARKMLDDAGFPDASIVASNDLDEYRISELKAKDAKIAVWGVGTRLSTAYDQPALGGVYKLNAMQEQGTWTPRIKLSNTPAKVSIPGRQQVRRFVQGGQYLADAIWDPNLGFGQPTLVDPTHGHELSVEGAEHRDLLSPAMRDGKRTQRAPSLTEIRAHAQAELEAIEAQRRLRNPDPYFCGLEGRLAARRTAMITAAKATS